MEGFCHSGDELVDVVEFAAPALQFPAQRLFAGSGFLQLVAKILVSFLETFPVTSAIAAGVADHEAEGGGHDHPYR